MTQRDECWVLAVITLVVLGMIILHPLAFAPANCNDPHTWSTASGVQACAIKEGK